jgi:hypothetical protein
MKKQIINLIVAIAWLISARFTGCQVIPDYYYPGDLQSETYSYTGIPNQKTLFLGFWMTPEMKAAVVCPFLSISQSGISQPENFEIRT